MRDGLSWWHPEPGPVPLADTTVAGLLDEAAADAPDAEAVVLSAYADLGLNIRWSYRQLHTRADALARALIALGIGAGDPVALYAPNVPQWLTCEFGVAKCGAVLVPVNPTYRQDELRYVLADSGAVACLFLPGFARLDLWAELAPVRGTLPALRHLISLSGPVGDVAALEDILAGAAQVPPDRAAARAAAVRAEDIAQLQYTSGTTGRPKGAALTHRGIVNNARQSAWRWRVGPGDRWCNPLPLFHTAGCAMLTLGAVAARAAHLPLIRFEPDRVLDTVEAERATILETVPTILTALLERQRVRRADLSSLRLVGTSGAPTPEHLGRACANEWNTPLRVLYGSTEVSPTVSGTALDEPAELGWTTVGRPLPGTEIRIVDPGTRAVTQAGEPGELEVRGYQVMAGYRNLPDATGEALTPDGWFRTGDLARLDAAGYLRIVGRLKDVIIRGGENLYPAEIEDALREHPDVLEVAVIGVPDAFFGEEACAAVRVREGAPIEPEQLRAWLANRVTHQKVPRYIRIVAELPQTASGKVQKFRLREQLTATLQDPESIGS
ncbi:MAG: AMP-binding protein [Trebonia sp.]